MISAWTSFYYQIFQGAKPLIYQVSIKKLYPTYIMSQESEILSI